MGFRVRVWLLGTVACAIVALSGSVAQAAEFGVEKFIAVNCSEGHEECAQEGTPPYLAPKEPSATEAREQGYTQAAGHPPFGITDFKINTIGKYPTAVPTGIVTHVRTDVAPGVSTNPEAVPQCTEAQFGTEVAKGVFTAPTCEAATIIGKNQVIVAVEPSPGTIEDVPLEGTVYNMVQPKGLASLFGVALDLTNVGHPGVFAHTLIEGHVEWAGDYHDYYEINVSPELPLISSRLVLKGNAGTTGLGGFITNPSNCAGPGAATTNTVTLKPSAGPEEKREYTAPIGTEGCDGLAPFLPVPFAPTFSLTPEPGGTQSDQPDGVTAELALPHDPSPTGIDSSQLKSASITLPEGMTLSPSAAPALQACTPAEIGIHSRAKVECPERSIIGNVTLDVPDLPAGSLTGKLFLGGPASGPITGPPYTMYIDAESERYDVSVRLKGEAVPNETTGRITATFPENPEQPFSDAVLRFNGGERAPIANPLTCGPATSLVSFTPYTGTANATPAVAPFTVDGNGKGGACAAPLPFALTQSTASQPTTGGAATNFAFNLGRTDGQQYLSKVSATLPLGLVGKIPVVPLCPEPQASVGTCSSASEIGQATTTVGSGPSPVQFKGPVYLTGPTGSAPYGMTTVINAAVGPFSLGNVVVRTGIEVNPITAQVTISGNVPTIVKGVPLRLKTLSVAINRQGFLVNPTNCGALTTNTTLTSTLGATQALSTPFQATGCSALGFKPKFGASSNAKTSRANGAALVVNVNIPSGPQANFKSVLVTVPKHLPSRDSTLKNACLEAVFNANPLSCPSNSKVGTARIKTPVLPGQLIGPAYFVSHGGAAFPDLDLVLKGDGVTIILVGNTNIKNGITTNTFAALPDVPFSGFELNLPSGPNSAVGAIGNVCQQSLVMPTTITAQNGLVFKQNTAVNVTGCPVTILSKRVSANKAIVTVRAPAAGRVSGGGSNLKTVYKHPGKAKNVTLEVPLSSSRRPISVRVRVGFVPKAKGSKSSVAYTTVTFK